MGTGVDKYKPNLLCGDGSRALVSILAVLPQKDYDENKDKETTLKDFEYYLSRDIQDVEYKDIISRKDPPNPAAVSHTCCALANFATNSKCSFCKKYFNT